MHSVPRWSPFLLNSRASRHCHHSCGSGSMLLFTHSIPWHRCKGHSGKLVPHRRIQGLIKLKSAPLYRRTRLNLAWMAWAAGCLSIWMGFMRIIRLRIVTFLLLFKWNALMESREPLLSVNHRTMPDRRCEKWSFIHSSNQICEPGIEHGAEQRNVFSRFH